MKSIRSLTTSKKPSLFYCNSKNHYTYNLFLQKQEHDKTLHKGYDDAAEKLVNTDPNVLHGGKKGWMETSSTQRVPDILGLDESEDVIKSNSKNVGSPSPSLSNIMKTAKNIVTGTKAKEEPPRKV
ncbi:hypothetical protein ABK040_008542 [Willaertia magna]